MLKLIKFQGLLLSPQPQPPNVLKGLSFVIWIFITTFAGAYIFSDTITLITIPTGIGLWTLNRILDSQQHMYKAVPVSQRFTVFNIFLTPFLLTALAIISFWLAQILLAAGLNTFIQPNTEFTPPLATLNVHGTFFLLLMLINIISMGTAIAFIRRKIYRTSAYAAFTILAFSLLSYTKSLMPVPQVIFLESLSLLPQINQLLTGMGIATLLIIPLSLYIGYKLYLVPPKH